MTENKHSEPNENLTGTQNVMSAQSPAQPVGTVLRRVEVRNGYIEIEQRGITNKIAAGPLSDQLVPRLCQQVLTADELAVAEMLGMPYVGVIVRGVGDVPGEEVHEVPDGEADE